MHVRAIILLLFVLILVAVTANAQPRPTGDSSIIPEDSKLETLFTGGVLTEGVSVGFDGAAYFSDITFTYVSGMQAGHIMKYDALSGTTMVFRSPSGMSNGIKFDAQGRMVVAEGADHGGRRITRTDMKTGKAEILAAYFEGRRLNSPNDLVIDEKGRTYFSDPRYLGDEPIDQALMAVYRIDPDGKVHRIVTDATKPNGVAVSPDQKTLYVGVNDNGTTGLFRVPTETPLHRGRMSLNAYDLLPDGTARFNKVLVDYYPDEGADGMVPDVEGNLYVAVRVASRPGICVYSPEGKELAYIPTPELPTNVAFGRGDEKTVLYITAGGSLHRIRLKKPGYHLPSR